MDCAVGKHAAGKSRKTAQPGRARARRRNPVAEGLPMRMTSEQVAAHQARFAPKRKAEAADHDGPESDLHQAIIDYCKSRAWYFVRQRMDMPSTTAVGVPDFIIATSGGRTLWIEVKRKGGKPTTPQLAAKQWLFNLGHESHIVWSFEEFLAAVTSDRPDTSQWRA